METNTSMPGNVIENYDWFCGHKLNAFEEAFWREFRESFVDPKYCFDGNFDPLDNSGRHNGFRIYFTVPKADSKDIMARLQNVIRACHLNEGAYLRSKTSKAIAGVTIEDDQSTLDSTTLALLDRICPGETGITVKVRHNPLIIDVLAAQKREESLKEFKAQGLCD